MDLSMLRVKLYKLNDVGTWDDYGTGHVNVEYYEQGVGLVVTNETDAKTLLVHSISRDTAYHRQGDDTIITWTDRELATDVALSFQAPAGCNRVWRQIQEVQGAGGPVGRDGMSLSPGGGGGGSPGGAGSPLSGGAGGGVFLLHRGTLLDDYDSPGGGSPYDELGHMAHPGMAAAAAVELPPPSLDNLGAIAEALHEASLFQRDALAGQMLAPGYIPRLLACFRTAEDLEDEATLVAANAAVRGAILLNDTAVLETLFSDDYADDVIGALEYGPEVMAPGGVGPASRPRHRDHLAGPGALREVVPIADPALRSKILQAHRMGYVKDVVMPRTLDDATFATLSSLQLFNQVEVLAALQADPEFFPALFAALRAAAPGSQPWRDLVGFLQELVGLSRHLQSVQRNALLSRLVDLGLFQALAEVLAAGDAAARLRAADVLLSDVTHDPAPLRAFLQTEGADLFRLLVSAVLDPSAAGLQEQALEILKVLLDPETMDSSVEKDQFIDTFYTEHVGRLLSAVSGAADGGGGGSSSGSAPAPTLVLVLDLLCYCVQQHSYRIKYYILRNNVVDKVLRLLRRRERAVGAAALRLLRTCLAMRDEFYNRYLVKNGLMEPVLAAFAANGRRYNLLNSAILELFDFVRRENMKGVAAALVESPQWATLEAELDQADTMCKLRARHEQNNEAVQAVASAAQAAAAVGPADRGAVLGPVPASSQPSAGVGAAPSGDAGAAARARAAEAAAAAARSAAALAARRARGEREEDADEENYFREDEDDDEEGGGGGDTVNVDALRAASPPAAGGGGTHGNEPFRHGLRPGQAVLEAFSPLPGFRAGRLVEYDDEDDDDTLPLGAVARARATAALAVNVAGVEAAAAVAVEEAEVAAAGDAAPAVSPLGNQPLTQSLPSQPSQPEVEPEGAAPCEEPAAALGKRPAEGPAAGDAAPAEKRSKGGDDPR